MEGIYNATDEFPFSKLLLLKPTAVTGGNYFIKFRINELPLYIQTPKCNTKQGILKAGKKYFSDLMFTNEHESFIQWIEKLENYSQKYIYDHREMWFDTELDLHDIENSFSSCVKLYKSGKYYIVRTHVPTQLGKCSLKIYNESEDIVQPEDITDKNDIITILEFQGIKCSARSFQIEIEIKQILVLPDSNIFEKCILVKGKSKSESHDVSMRNLGTLQDVVENKEISDYDLSLNTTEYLGKPQANMENAIDTLISKKIIQDDIPKQTCDISESRELEDVDEDTEESSTELKEIELSLDEIPENEQIQIKTRNDVYYKMYQDAKKKAKLAKDLALSAYLEAKRIKNTYMLADLDDSDSDLDEESFYEKQE